MSDKRCGSCVYVDLTPYYPVHGDVICRRHAPVPFLDTLNDATLAVGRWPLVDCVEDWCGEWVAR